MTNKKDRTVLDILDSTELPTKRNVICDNEPLGDAILEFLQLKATGHPKAAHLTLTWFYEKKLRPEFGGPASMHTVRTYVREILKLDPATGNPL